MDARLVMFRESGDRRDFPLTAEVTTIGRKDDCDIRIPLSEVSRHHAELHLTDNGVKVKDLGSANGTFVNNKKVKITLLKAGDHVVVGPVVFTYQLDGVPTDIRAVKTKLRSISANSATAEEAPEPAAPVYEKHEEVDPISALEALASSADQTAIDAFEDEDDVF
jgi:pSer/pThr/pTyr-binding forkhead associated (FHA) protein